MAGTVKVRQIEEDRLSMISRMSQAVVDVSKKDMSEVKSYAAPPVAVKDVLDVTLILLGYDKSNVNWKTAKQLMGQSGDDALQKRIAAVDPETITPAQRKKASEILSKYNVEDIANVSKATKTMFLWAQAVSED